MLLEKFLLSFVFPFAIQATLLGQVPDLNALRTLLSSDSGKKAYTELLKDYEIDAFSLDIQDGVILYYGRLFQPGFMPFNIDPRSGKFERQVIKGRFKKAIPMGERMLASDPLSLEMLMKMLVCYRQSGDNARADSIQPKIEFLMAVILAQGSGKERENTLKVVTIADEYAAMAYLRVKGVSRKTEMLPNSALDVWAAVDSDGKEGTLYVELLRDPDFKMRVN